jgi:hypothetical protein
MTEGDLHTGRQRAKSNLRNVNDSMEDALHLIPYFTVWTCLVSSVCPTVSPIFRRQPVSRFGSFFASNSWGKISVALTHRSHFKAAVGAEISFDRIVDKVTKEV